MQSCLGLGANLGDPAATLSAALDALRRWPETQVLATSRLYRSAPMGPPDQPDYCNAVVRVATTLSPEAVLSQIQQTEQAFGRDRTGERWGARSLDIDLLLYGNQRIATPALTVPHAGLAQRAFVLLPLLDVAPTLVLPDGSSLAALAAAIDQAGIHGVQAWTA